MLKRIGKKLVQGAKAELDENPPKILNTEKIIDAAVTILEFGILCLAILGATREPKEHKTTVINNYYYYK